MLIENDGPKLEGEEIAGIEAELGATLPDSYRHFLLRHNGGAPDPDTVDVPGLHGTPTDVQVFFGIGRPVESSNLSWNLSLAAEQGLRFRILPIARDSGGGLFCLKVERGVASEVVYWEMDVAEGKLYPIASTFDEFIGKIRPFEQ